MIELSDSEIQQIEGEALEKYPNVEDDDTGVNLANGFRHIKRKAFIAGATLYAKRAKEQANEVKSKIALIEILQNGVSGGIAELEGKINTIEEIVTTLRAQLQERDKEIAKLKGDLKQWAGHSFF